jgi:hypothetical protein
MTALRVDSELHIPVTGFQAATISSDLSEVRIVAGAMKYPTGTPFSL